MVLLKHAGATVAGTPVEYDADSQAVQRIADLELDLQQTRENLQATIEELETTNEEQQATNQEMLASNEELQSTNEELQSVNEELYSVNAEFQSKIGELTALNNDMDNLLRSTDIGTVFLDRELRIRKFTPAVTSVIKLLDHDIGRPIDQIAYSIDMGHDDLLARCQAGVGDGQARGMQCHQSQRHVAVDARASVSRRGGADGRRRADLRRHLGPEAGRTAVAALANA